MTVNQTQVNQNKFINWVKGVHPALYKAATNNLRVAKGQRVTPPTISAINKDNRVVHVVASIGQKVPSLTPIIRMSAPTQSAKIVRLPVKKAGGVVPTTQPWYEYKAPITTVKKRIPTTRFLSPAKKAEYAARAQYAMRGMSGMGGLAGDWGDFFSDLTTQIIDIAPKYLSYKEQKAMLEAQIDRAKRGLPPLQTQAYSVPPPQQLPVPAVIVPPSPVPIDPRYITPTQEVKNDNYVLPVALGIGAIGILFLLKKM